MDRRRLLKSLAAGVWTGACSLAAHPLMTTVTLAASDGGKPLGDHRLITVILRGAMDGLELVRPVGDAQFARYRPTLSNGEGLDLGGYFQLSPHLSGLGPLWAKGQLGFVHATSTPYRDQRSHFEGQDMLEAGTGLDVAASSVRDGWMNRMLQAVPGLTAQTAFAFGPEAAPLLQGAAPASNWSPELRLDLSPQSRLLLDHIYHDDPLFRDAATEAIMLTESIDLESGRGPVGAMDMAGAKRLAETDRLVDFAAGRLREETRIAAFSLSGWDTHRNQSGAIGPAMRRLERVILRLEQSLGPDVWGKTLILAMTEFGRTVAENGSHGTDHGTGGAMLLAGGALRGGRVLGPWPGLDEAALYDRRDLMPTSDVRDWAAWSLRGMYGFERNVLENSVFPGLIMGADPGILL